MTTSKLGAQSTEEIRSGDPESRLGAQSTEVVIYTPGIKSRLSDQSTETVIDYSSTVESHLGSQSIEVIVPSSGEVEEPPCEGLLYHFKASDIDGAGTAAVPGTTYTSIYNHATGETYTTSDTNPEYKLYSYVVNKYNNIVVDFSEPSDSWFKGNLVQLNRGYKDLNYRAKISDNVVFGTTAREHSYQAADLEYLVDTPSEYNSWAVAEVNIAGFDSGLDYSIYSSDPDQIETIIEEIVPFPSYIELGYKDNGNTIYSDVDGTITTKSISNPAIPPDGDITYEFWATEANEITLCYTVAAAEPCNKSLYHFKVSDIDGAGTVATPGTVYTSIYNHATSETYTTTDTNPDYILYPFKVSEFNNFIADAPSSSAKWFEGHFDVLDKTYQDLSYKLTLSDETLTGDPPVGFHKQRAVDLQFDRDWLAEFSIFAESYLQGSAGYFYYSVFIEDAANNPTELSDNYVPYPTTMTFGYKNQGTILYSNIDGVVTEQVAVNPDIPPPGQTRFTVWIGEANEINIYCGQITEPPPPVTPNPILDFIVPTDRSVYLDLVAKDNPLAGWMPGRYIEDNNVDGVQIIANYYGERIRIPLYPPGYEPPEGGGYQT